MKELDKLIFIGLSLPNFLTLFLCLTLLFLSGYGLGQVSSAKSSTNTEDTSTPKTVSFQSFQIKNLAQSKLPQTGSDLKMFENRVYGYSFCYPHEIEVKYKNKVLCTNKTCLNQTDFDTVEIGSLYLNSSRTNSTLGLEYEKGFDKEKFKSLYQVKIDGTDYYYLVSKEGFVELITSSVVEIDDIIWTKKDTFVNGTKGDYFISFSKGSLEDKISEGQILYLNQIFNEFKF